MEWDAGFLARSPMFEPLRSHAGAFGADWPRLADLQRLLDQRNPPPRNTGGMPLRVVPQGRRPVAFEDGYEPRLYLRGELQVRERSWHDLFNVLVWLAFPLAKAALNARHYAALEAQCAPEGGAGIGAAWSRGPFLGDATVEPIIGASHRRSSRAAGGQIPEGPSSAPRRAPLGMRPQRRASHAGNEALVPSRAIESAGVPKVETGTPPRGRARRANRGPAQDALTLFDEGGVIVASSEDELLARLRDWRWKDLFWDNRARLAAQMRFHLFGHAVYENALRPFLGITSRGILLKVEPDVLEAPLPEQLAALDARIARRLGDARGVLVTRDLAVVPVLGVPGWHAGNDVESFYDNTDYFRPGRRAADA